MGNDSTSELIVKEFKQSIGHKQFTEKQLPIFKLIPNGYDVDSRINYFRYKNFKSNFGLS